MGQRVSVDKIGSFHQKKRAVLCHFSSRDCGFPCPHARGMTADVKLARTCNHVLFFNKEMETVLKKKSDSLKKKNRLIHKLLN